MQSNSCLPFLSTKRYNLFLWDLHARAFVLVVFVSNYVVVLFSFDIVANVLISPCIFLLILFDIYPISFFSQNLNMSIYNSVSNCQEYSLKWINKTAGFVKCFLVEYLLTAISSMPDISTSVLKQKIYKTYMCSCYKIARLYKLHKRVHSTRSRK